MAVSVKIPTQLRSATEGDAQADVNGSTDGEVLDSLYQARKNGLEAEPVHVRDERNQVWAEQRPRKQRPGE